MHRPELSMDEVMDLAATFPDEIHQPLHECLSIGEAPLVRQGRKMRPTTTRAGCHEGKPKILLIGERLRGRLGYKVICPTKTSDRNRRKRSGSDTR